MADNGCPISLEQYIAYNRADKFKDPLGSTLTSKEIQDHLAAGDLAGRHSNWSNNRHLGQVPEKSCDQV
jgi:hypothetical protein